VKRSLTLEPSLVTFEASDVDFLAFATAIRRDVAFWQLFHNLFDMSSLVNQSWTRVTWGFCLQFSVTPDVPSLYYSNVVWAETDQFWDLKGGV